MNVIVAIDYILRTYPDARYQGGRHAGHPVLEHLGVVRQHHEDLAGRVQPSIPWVVKASTGIAATWANVPWVGLLDPKETTSAQEGRYVTSMFAADGSAFAVAVVWGTQKVRREIGRGAAEFLLRRRADGAQALAEHLPPDHSFQLDRDLDLAAGTPLARDYERSCLAWRRWSIDELPGRETLDASLTSLIEGLGAWLHSEVG